MNLFNVGAFFVLFREALEASLILCVLLRYLDKTITGNPELLKKLKRQVWGGTIVGLGISVILGVVFTIVFYVLKTDVLGDNMPLFEGILLSVAVLLLTWLAFKMVSVNDMYAKWESKINQASILNIPQPNSIDHSVVNLKNIDEADKTSAIPSTISDLPSLEYLHQPESDSSSTNSTRVPSIHKIDPLDHIKQDKSETHVITIESKSSEDSFKKTPIAPTGYGFMLLTFSVIIREGLESVIFIAGVGGGDPISLIIPGILGIVIGVAIGYALYRGSGSLNLKIFFAISTAILLVIASGLACNASWELEEWYYKNVINFNVEGTMGGNDEEGGPDNEETGGYVTIPERSPILWDLSDCCSEYENPFFQVMATLVGWKSTPSVVTTSVYFGYWCLVAVCFGIKRLKSTKAIKHVK